MTKLDLIKQKIVVDREELRTTLAFWSFKEQRIVFTNGCFDILHRGHVEYLAQAAGFGDKLVLGLNSDISVKRLKGNSRPINDEMSRAVILASLSFVDKVVFFGEDTPYELIDFIQPDVLVKGGDYSINTIVGADIVREKGGEVRVIDFLEGFSTTKTIEELKK